MYEDAYNDDPMRCSCGTSEEDGIWMNHSDRIGTIMSVTVWILFLYSGLTVVLLAQHRHCPKFVAAVYCTLCALALASHIKTSLTDPGSVPSSAVPITTNVPYHTMCSVCQTYKPDRAHHCRICNRCISRMDHHCPWMNTCIGKSWHGLIWRTACASVDSYLTSTLFRCLLCRSLQYQTFPPLSSIHLDGILLGVVALHGELLFLFVTRLRIRYSGDAVGARHVPAVSWGTLFYYQHAHFRPVCGLDRCRDH